MKSLLLLPIILVLFSCNGVNDETDGNKPINNKEENSSQISQLHTNSKAQILNNIIVHEKGLQLSRAYLTFDDGTLVPAQNQIPLNTSVYLNLHVEKGFATKNGKVTIGASEKIITDKGEIVANTPDLFSTTSVIALNKAKQIQLKAFISKTRKDLDHFIVSYRLWDKQSNAEVNGSYKLYISDEKDDVE